ncbi:MULTISPECIES: undecaprenyl-diphosphate phosphatase [unclassified Paenibacillus]|uniref:undecaprenyl-diphosphate phosphatase n=1 Tax=unclassified Paenibacillus TaxID=185978 RepID=UPI001AE5F74A|nr:MULTISPECIES: undecaprenyl-diphosphate phosphatase [unclassified Paenibacillus]MBP1154567.1 undecaprenyl-diphosphatase [Paenibacillus sp. PvP091]MBP1170049.1 undecaprenyl-diphosphatase [Paenibacillus sp. PvR098]MBP2441077.1 undecaprenyl-diphosphatase [Paenibacillus sp. PvP052]
MYDWWVAVIIGIVEGLTEFLPISSTGHMILTGTLLGIPETDELIKSFEIVIQLGAILAVVIVYWQRILRLFGLGRERPTAGKGMNLLHILLAIVPAMTVAYLLSDFIKEHLFSPQTVLIGLVLGGILLIIGEKQQPAITASDVDELTYKQAFMIGLWQIVALWPGFSRSGSTIAGAMLAGASRGAAADFTFIIAIPVMVVATGYEMLKSAGSFSSADIGFFAVGFVVSFVVALLAVVTFIKFVQKFSLTYFAYYRFILAGLFWFFILR